MNNRYWVKLCLLGATAITLAACQSTGEKAQSDSLTLQKDALTLDWNNTWSSSLKVDDGRETLDLAPILAADGGLVLDINVERLAQGDLKLFMDCGDECRRVVDLTDAARELEGEGWQRASVPLSCFARPNDQLAAISEPFIAEGGGSGRVSFANIRLEESVENTFNCLTPAELPVTPAPLTANWALEWWMPRHEEKLNRIASGDVELLMIGDSITHGWEDPGKDVWQEYFGDRKAVNLGFSGDRTENVLWRLEHGEVEGISPEVAVLMIGTNNAGHRQEAPELTAKGVATVIDELKARLPETDILLLGIFPRGATADDPLRKLNRQTNAYLEKLGRDERVTYLNINDAFLEADGDLSKDIMPDLLHPNEKGYAIWAEAMEPTLSKLLKD